MRASRIVRAAAVGMFILGAAHITYAQSPGERIEGQVTRVDLVGQRELAVRWNNQIVVQPIHVSTRLVFHECAECFPNPELSDLKPGMNVHFDYNPNEPLERLHVDSVPAEMRRVTPDNKRVTADRDRGSDRGDRGDREDRGDRGSDRGDQPSGVGRDLLVKIQDIDERRGEFRADVAGRAQSFVADNPRDLRRWRVGDLVVITVERRSGGEVVTKIRAGSMSGRVIDVNRRRGEMRLEVDGRQGMYYVDDKDLLNDIRVGDKIRFEVAESHGRQVITALH